MSSAKVNNHGKKKSKRKYTIIFEEDQKTNDCGSGIRNYAYGFGQIPVARLHHHGIRIISDDQSARINVQRLYLDHRGGHCLNLVHHFDRQRV